MNGRRTGNGTISVGAAARSADVAASTLRYYERLGLLVPEARAANGYRQYTAVQIERLRFIRAAQTAGFTLEDIRRLLGLSQAGQHECRSAVQGLIAARLTEVRNKIRDLKRVQEVLELGLARCRRSKKECPVLNELSSTTSKGEKR
ncbi:Mercuric resistance operon regulatory protein [Phycisphaerae bacterium RAS1]|nr:Mercuric resistance operon regulatory protein [Phycisphaerae bacterium RAS1]